MKECKHEAGLSDFIQVLQDKDFANMTHALYRCKLCGGTIEKVGEPRKENGVWKTYLVWELFATYGYEVADLIGAEA